MREFIVKLPNRCDTLYLAGCLTDAGEKKFQIKEVKA